MTAEAPAAPALSYGRLLPVTVHFDDLDALGLLHNARYPVIVENAPGPPCGTTSLLAFEGDWDGRQLLQRRQGAADQLRGPDQPPRRVRRPPLAGAPGEHQTD